MTSTAILIPARYESKRFPGKPLTKLGGISMIQRVFNTCYRSGIDVCVLTDDERIANGFPPQLVHLDKADYSNGTERCSGAISDPRFNKYDQFINVQGDMPDITSQLILKVLWHLKNYSIATIFTDLDPELKDDPNAVKMVRSGDKALWFGRGLSGYGERHLGIYGYKRNPLELYSTLDVTTEEKAEELEQLRWLKAGYDIGCLKVPFNGLEINTPQDAEKWNEKAVADMG